MSASIQATIFKIYIYSSCILHHQLHWLKELYLLE